ncbi:phage tail length tape measure family protein [Pasteurella multocida]|uniref:phage tail length tape measure family protein n=1 Tax=Pasteurella multocida TaxID=747 RepID=UPI001479B5AD|nr:phage tail length tape measure family protein [Pasteurella multocida]NNI76315.1 hypothetical protein [Pasteurella multocida]
MNQISNLKIKLTAETAKFTEEINKAINSLGKLGKAKGSIDLTKVALRGLAVTAFAAVSAAAVQGISIYAETERYMARTEAQLKATGAAVGFTASELDKFARSVAMNTLASTDGIRNAMSVLMTFKSVTGDIFKQTISLAQDLAEVFKTDVASEARNLGRALETPTEAVSILKRKGIELSESQQELIKKFVESGEKAKAQELILHELQKRVGGAGQAAANDTVTGALDTLGQVTQELKEEFAKATGITDIFKKSVNGLAKAFIWLREKIAGPSDMEAYVNELEQSIKKNEELLKLKKQQALLASSTQYWSTSSNDAEIQRLENGLARQRGILAEARAKLEEQEKKALAQQNEALKIQADNELKERQQASAASINELNKRLATRREKLDAQYNKDIKMIESLTLSKEQIEEQGFQNIEALRKAHIEKVTKQYNAEKAELDKLESKKVATAKSSYQDQLSALDLRYATETQKIELNHQLQIKKIQQMSISEKDARAKGFSSALELRKHYLALENQAFDKAMTDQKEKIRREEQERSDKVRSFFNEIRGSGNDQYVQNDIIRDEQLAKAEEMHKQQLLSVEEFEKAKATIEDAYRQRKEDLDRESAQAQLSAAASLFDGLAGLMEATAGRNSSAYRTMFALSKSFQIAQSLLNLHAAVMKAMNDPTALTPAQKFANMAAVATAGANVLNQLTSITLSGARAMGGPVGGGRAYLVGEKGPEIFVPGASGQITSNENLNKALGGGSNKTVVINQTNNFDSSNSDNLDLAKSIAKQTKAVVYEVLKNESRSGGMLGGR